MAEDAPRRRPARAVAEWMAPALPALDSATGILRRSAFVNRIKLLALAVGSTVEVDVARDVVVESVPRIEIYPQSWNRIRLAHGTRIGDGLRLSLRGGTLDVGERSELRRLGTYQIGGTMTVGSGVVLSTGVVIHCADAVSIADWSIVGEYTTITDSAHVRTGADQPIHPCSETAPTRIGRNAWIGAHAVITRGVTVGDQAFVGAGAVVNRDVEAGWLVGGVPARPLRPLDQ